MKLFWSLNFRSLIDLNKLVFKTNFMTQLSKWHVFFGPICHECAVILEHHSNTKLTHKYWIVHRAWKNYQPKHIELNWNVIFRNIAIACIDRFVLLIAWFCKRFRMLMIINCHLENNYKERRHVLRKSQFRKILEWG